MTITNEMFRVLETVTHKCYESTRELLGSRVRDVVNVYQDIGSDNKETYTSSPSAREQSETTNVFRIFSTFLLRGG